ncbi:SDR family NAD(P)-dependent oxidoreductase [Neorhodopirellula pilleata]|uniref:3-oxoacyl-[acyl-carrier-protein] reductase FabG n=1 Tax=Neorhodopirellula pilleata TaxID=2714738 RepID=A0A5C6AWJ1_9BACT|nr:SDR family oxidoreductase [Neorhodopirellula pilleata]TWU03998.1 3-oxoacyl-[acyl-carrier-protein] reductase FabG [Neorhodopirellula pilleata]
MPNSVVTGASSGIGRAIAIRLARDPLSQTVVHYRGNLEGARQTAATIEASGGMCHLIQADLSQADDISRLADQAFKQLGTIDAWVNNAGLDVLTGEASGWTFDQKLRALLDVDLCGTISLSRIVGDRLIEQSQASGAQTGAPSMVFIGWDQAPEGMEGDAGMMFGPVKAAVMAFANSLAQTLAPHVRVNTVAPGWIQTAWGETTQGYWDERARSQALMHRWGRPEDIAEAVSYLTSEAASFVTGQTININGGFNRRFEL